MKREFSAGGIVFNDKDQLLLTQHSQNKSWGFPKGLIDPGQTSKEAALREVKEEGGVEAEIIERVGYSKYVYTFGGEKIFKVVTIYLMKYLSGDPKDHDWEMMDAKFVDENEVKKTLTFKSDQKAFEKILMIKYLHV